MISTSKDNIEGKDLKESHPHEERQNTIRCRAINQGERLGRVKPSIMSPTQLKDTAKTWVPGKERLLLKALGRTFQGMLYNVETSAQTARDKGFFKEF